MKNITLSVEEEVLTAIRRYVAQRDTTVNKLVRDFFQNITQQQEKACQVRKQLRQMSQRSKARIGSATWNREELHDR